MSTKYLITKGRIFSIIGVLFICGTLLSGMKLFGFPARLNSDQGQGVNANRTITCTDGDSRPSPLRDAANVHAQTARPDADWKEFDSGTLGFRIRIPPQFVCETSPVGQTLSMVFIAYDPTDPPIDGNPAVEILASNVPCGEGAEEPLNFVKAMYSTDVIPQWAIATSTTIGDVPAVRLTILNAAGGSPVQEQTFVGRNCHEFVVQRTPSENRVLEEIASTFSFTE
jgi:hypothetical protein